MATIDSKSSSNYPSARWSLDYTIGSSSAGKTTVNYTLYTRGRSGYSSNTALATFCYMKIYDTNGTLLKSYSYDSTSAISFTGQSRDSGSFTVYHDDAGYGGFRVDFNVQFYPYTAQAGLTSSETVDIPTISFAYTKCSAPTSITASGIVAPNGEVLISWSGANDGASNSISGYDIYWKISSNGAAPSTSNNDGKKSVSTTSKSGSATINIGNATRGHTVVFGIVAKGSAGASYYSGIKTGGNVKINSLPTKPSSGSVSPEVISSKGGEVTFTIHTGTDIDSSQTIGLRYATSVSGERKACGTSFTLNLKTGGSYYFWSYDGLEDSAEYIKLNVSVNTTPTVSIVASGTTQQVDSANALSNATYVLNPTITLTNDNNGQQKNNKYNYYIHYSTNNSSWTKQVLWKDDQSNKKTIDDIRTLGYFDLTENGYYYYFSATRNDGLDVSTEVNTSSEKFYIPKRPKLIGIYNTQNYSNINIAEFQGYFSKALSFRFQKDTGYNSLKIYHNSGLIETIPLKTEGNYLCGQWLNNNLTKGTYNFSGEIGHIGNNFYNQAITLGSLYKIENLEAKNLTAKKDFQVYASDTSYSFSIYNTFNVDYDELTSSKYKEYGILDIEKSFYARITIDGKSGKEQFLTIAEKADGMNTVSHTIYFTLTSEQLYNMLPEIENKDKTYVGMLTVGFADVFDNHTETSINYIINYGSIPIASNISIKVNKNKEINTWAFLKEGMPLTISGMIQSYNSRPKLQVLINRIKDGEESGYVAFGEPIELIYKAENIENPQPTLNKPTIYTFSDIEVITIGEIIELEYKVNFKIKIVTDASEDYHYISNKLYIGDINVCGHSSQGEVILDKIDYFSYNKSYLEYQYTNINLGAPTNIDQPNYSLSLIAKLEYRNISETKYSNIINEIGINSLEDFLGTYESGISTDFVFPQDMDAFVCRMIITTTQKVSNDKESYSTTKTLYTNEQAVYNIMPTVSYRKNLLGINATNLYHSDLQNAVLVIGEHSSKNIIYFLSSAGTKKLNTSTGQLSGFVINGGTWDKI